MRNIITAALLGALTVGSANLAAADDHHHRRGRHDDRDRDRDLRVLDSQYLRDDRGRVELDLTPGLRRDGLMLTSDQGVGIAKVQFIYSDGRVVTLRGRMLARLPQENGALIIQTGRPPGLRHVRVWYRLIEGQRSAELRLVSFGDGYTTEEDLVSGQ